MKLISMTATFGCLNRETLRFEEGMTLLGATNGSGKSTWCAFLRTMLYGLDTRQRDKKGALADKNRYRPWNGAPMEGLLVCEHQGKVIEIRRTSEGGLPMGTFSAVEQKSGLPVAGLTGETAGETLTGISREVFDRSVYIRQTGLAVSQSQELEKRIASLVTSGQEDTSWSEADGRLRAWQRSRRYNKSGRIPQMEAEAEALRNTIRQTADLRQEAARLENRAEELREQKDVWQNRMDQETSRFRTESRLRLEKATAELQEAENRVRTLEENRREEGEEDSESLREDILDLRDDLKSRRHLMTGFVVLVVLLTLAGIALFVLPRYYESFGLTEVPLGLPMLPLPFIGAFVAGLWLLVLIFLLGKAIADHRARKEIRRLLVVLDTWEEQEKERGRALEEAVRHRDQARKYYEAVEQQGQGGPYRPPEAQACSQSLGQVEQELAALRGKLSAMGDPLAADVRLDELEEEISVLQRDYDAIEVALDAMKEADRQLHARFSPKLSEKTGEYFARLTGGRYRQIFLTRDLEITVREEDSLAEHPLSALSQGTADQLYLALRLAVAELLLPEGEDCPLILDDALVAFDDTRLELALDTLLELSKHRQVLLFTCQHREFAALEKRKGVGRHRGIGF